MLRTTCGSAKDAAAASPRAGHSLNRRKDKPKGWSSSRTMMHMCAESVLTACGFVAVALRPTSEKDAPFDRSAQTWPEMGSQHLWLTTSLGHNLAMNALTGPTSKDAFIPLCGDSAQSCGKPDRDNMVMITTNDNAFALVLSTQPYVKLHTNANEEMKLAAISQMPPEKLHAIEAAKVKIDYPTLPEDQYLTDPAKIDRLDLNKVQKHYYMCLLYNKADSGKPPQWEHVDEELCKQYSVDKPLTQMHFIRLLFADQGKEILQAIEGKGGVNASELVSPDTVRNFLCVAAVQTMRSMTANQAGVDVLLPSDFENNHDLKNLSWDDLVGDFGSLRRDISSIVQGSHILQAIRRNTRGTAAGGMSNFLVFTGAPGTGKTLAAKIIARLIRVPIVIVKPNEMMSKFVGETENRMADILKLGSALGLFYSHRGSPGCIVFIDEIDTIAGSRTNLGNASDKSINRCLTNLLQHLDGFTRNKTLVIGTTNVQSFLDPALISRAITVSFPVPDNDDRAKIFAKNAKHLSNETCKKLASDTKGLSGRDIREICNEAERALVPKFMEMEATMKEQGKEEQFYESLENAAPPPNMYASAVKNRKKHAEGAKDNSLNAGMDWGKLLQGVGDKNSDVPDLPEEKSLKPEEAVAEQEQEAPEVSKPVTSRSMRSRSRRKRATAQG